MKIINTLVVFVALVSCYLCVSSASAMVEQVQDANNVVSPDTLGLRRFLQTLDGDQTSTTHYTSSLYDLNDDGINEAIVYLIGRKWCGSGGCNTLVLEKHADSWLVVSLINITRPPIRVLSEKSNGWHALGVWVEGGGIREGYEALLAFNGKTYPRNPTIPPAEKVSEGVAGEEVISQTIHVAPLFDKGK